MSNEGDGKCGPGGLGALRFIRRSLTPLGGTSRAFSFISVVFLGIYATQLIGAWIRTRPTTRGVCAICRHGA